MEFDPILLAIIDASVVPEADVSDRIAAAGRGGATWLQIRAKDLATGDFVRYVRSAGQAAMRAGLPFLINDRVDIASLVEAAGVHVGGSDLPVTEARALLGEGALVGASARTADRAARAEANGADYIGIGPQFASPTKPELVPLPPGRTAEIRQAVSIPIIGIGGIDDGNAAEAARRGLDGIAVISGIWSSDDTEGSARRLAAAFRSGRSH